jgi:hypothetical protein
VKIQQVFGGPGIGAATISAVGHVGAAAVLGTSFPSQVGDNVTVSGGNSNAGISAPSHTNINNNNTASGGSGAAGGTPPGLINNPGHDGSSGNPP